MLQRQCTFYFRTSSWTRLRCLPIMAITLKRFWIQYLGDRPLLIFSCSKLSLFYIHIFPFILFALFTLHLLWKAWGMCQRCKAHHHSWDAPAVGSCMMFVFWDRKATSGTYLSIIPWNSQRTLPSIKLNLIAQFSSISFVFRELELTKLIVIRNVPVFVVKVLSFPASSVVRVVCTFLRFGWGILLWSQDTATPGFREPL